MAPLKKISLCFGIFACLLIVSNVDEEALLQIFHNSPIQYSFLRVEFGILNWNFNWNSTTAKCLHKIHNRRHIFLSLETFIPSHFSIVCTNWKRITGEARYIDRNRWQSKGLMSLRNQLVAAGRPRLVTSSCLLS